MKEFQDMNMSIEEYHDSLKKTAKFNTTVQFTMINWLAPDLDMVFDYTQRLIGPPSVQCPTGKKWCCTINMTNTIDDGMFAFCPADINIAICPHLDPECILLDNPIEAGCALIYCKAKPESESMKMKHVLNHIKVRISDTMKLAETDEITQEALDRITNEEHPQDQKK